MTPRALHDDVSEETSLPCAEPNSGHILIAEDDPALSQFLLRILRSDNFCVEQTFTGTEALERLAPEHRLLILDLNLPGADGLTVLHGLRPRFPDLPVLVLTARSRVESTVLALEAGANDCLTKPFSYVELLARVRALLRRNTNVTSRSSRCGDLSLDRDRMRVSRGGQRLELTPREYSLLEFLMRSAGKPVTRSALKENVWGSELESSTNIVDVYMKYLRDKVDAPGLPRLIRTVRSVGYMVSED